MKKHVMSLFVTIVFVFGVIGSQTGSATTYQVQKGDTLWDIAVTENVTVEELVNWNDLNSSLIFPGQEINISSQQDVYVVQKGDTLSQIATTHQIALSDLKRWNQIRDHLIFPGDPLTMDGQQQIPVSSSQQAQKKAPSPTTDKNVQNQRATEPKAQAKAETPSTEQAPTAASGKEMTVTATAYTAYCEGCSGTTYTGINLRANPNQKVIAVDPAVIPLGSRVWVEGYGEAIAGDIGGAIKGNIIDVFLEHQQEALNWGRRTVKIKVLE